jgi:5'-methylthioadenosine phosphorylase
MSKEKTGYNRRMNITKSIPQIAIIGGTGVGQFASFLSDAPPEPLIIETCWGTASLLQGSLQGKGVVFLARHGGGHKVPPHRINYRANIAALVKLGIKAVVATTATGGLRTDLRPGTFVVLDNFIDFAMARTGKTFFDETPVHTDFTDPYSPELRDAILHAAQSLNLPVEPTGTYLCGDGPRYETPAEVKLFASWGADVVGMTGVPEVTLAREAGLHYASISLVTNPGAGISTTPLTHSEVEEAMREAGPRLRDLLTAIIVHIAPETLPLIGPGVAITL